MNSSQKALTILVATTLTFAVAYSFRKKRMKKFNDHSPLFSDEAKRNKVNHLEKKTALFQAEAKSVQGFGNIFIVFY